MKRLACAITSTSVVLRDPLKGNNELMNTNSIIRESRGGTSHGLSDWLPVYSYNQNFRPMTKLEVIELRDFAIENAGLALTYSDWDGDTETNTKHVILDVKELVITNHRYGCDYTVSFGLEEL